MKVRVDSKLCTGAEICTQVCSEIFEMKGDKSVAKMGEVPKDLEGCVRQAVNSCPSEAIIIEE